MPHQQPTPYDLFISYAQADRAWVEGYLLDALHAAGVACHSQETFALGAPRLAEFERAVVKNGTLIDADEQRQEKLKPIRVHPHSPASDTLIKEAHT